MKKIISILIITIILGISSAAMAEKPSITIGLKTWAATWESVSPYSDETVKSDYGLMYGPGVNIRYQKFFGGLTYMIGSFSFPEEIIDNLFDVSTDADRADLDLWVGYYFHRYIGVFVGYKTINLDFTDKSSDLDVSVDTNVKYNGPAFGVTGYYPIGESRWVLFGNLGYVSLDGEVEGESIDDKTTGPAVEFGGAYAFENMPLSISVGYKYQNYESNDIEDIFSGLTLGANYTF